MLKLRLTGTGATVRANRLLFLSGVGLGSLVAYLLAFFGDGRLGRRRRALAGAKAAHLARAGIRQLGTSRRGVTNHLRGLWARIRARLRDQPASDDVIEQRVRAALGRVSRHVSIIEVACTDGRVTLAGPILEREHRHVLRAVRRINGVREIDDCLERHVRADIPSLKDGRPRGPRGTVHQRRCMDIMKTNLQVVREDDSLRVAAETMAAANVGFLPVCDDWGKAVGTITDRDIVVRAVAQTFDPDLRRVGEIMSRSVITCRPYDDITLAEQFMAQYQVSRLVVTDDDDVLVGVISLSDIAEVEPARRSARTLRSVAAREAPTAH
jgi:CBS domain-containing protein